MKPDDRTAVPALLQRAAACLQRGDPRGALVLLRQAEQLRPAASDAQLIEIQLNQAMVHRLLDQPDESLAAFDRVLVRDPGHFVAKLSKGTLVEQLAGPRAAAQIYREALALAPEAARLPPPLAEALRHARAIVDQDILDLQAYLRARTAATRARCQGERLNRFDESLDIFAGAARPYPQRPLLLQYSQLPAIPFHDRALFPWLPELEAATGMIVAELQALLQESSADFGPYVKYPPGAPVRQWGELNHSRRWSSYFLWENGVRNAAACNRCPGTAALIDRLPLMHQADFAPTAVFSALEPHTHIPPHTGSSTTRLLVHLPLILPGPARFRVGGETREWRMGQAWVFDDTIEHEAWNDADALRVILILDVWNPWISEAERVLIAEMMAAREGYYAGR